MNTDLRLMFPLLIHSILCLLPLLNVLDSLHHRADLDLLKWGREVGIEGECVRRIYITSRWVLLQDLVLRAGQRLQVSLEF